MRVDYRWEIPLVGGEVVSELKQGEQEAQDGLIERVRSALRPLGYAVAVHGSRERDLDLIAAPWVQDAETESGKITDALRDAGFDELGVGGKAGAHRRLGFALHGVPASAGIKYVDLSVLLAVEEPPDVPDEEDRATAAWHGAASERAMREHVQAVNDRSQFFRAERDDARARCRELEGDLRAAREAYEHERDARSPAKREATTVQFSTDECEEALRAKYEASTSRHYKAELKAFLDMLDRVRAEAEA